MSKVNISKIIKESERRNKYRQEFKKPWIENGFEFVTDAVRIVKLYTPLSDCDNFTPPFDVQKFFKPIAENPDDYVAVDLPSIEVIKENIKTLIGRAYTNKHCYYRLGDNADLAVVDAKLLVELLEILGSTKIYYNVNRPKNSPLFLHSDIGEALLMPIYDATDRLHFWCSVY